MHDTGDAKDKSFTVFHSAAEEADTKRENDAMKRQEQSWDNEGGHMSSTGGRVRRVASADLPYVVILARYDGEATEHGFATMREAEAFIRRNTPVPRAVLSTTYDRPASASTGSPTERESTANDEDSLAGSRSSTDDYDTFRQTMRPRCWQMVSQTLASMNKNVSG